MQKLSGFFSWFICPICFSIPEEPVKIVTIPYEEKYNEKYENAKSLYLENQKQHDSSDSDMQTKDRDLENLVLFESTPRGNIIMKFNKQEDYFYYYSNSKDFPYAILESVARKFVLSFHCFEIFKEMEKELEDVEEIKKLLQDKYGDKMSHNKLKETQEKVIKKNINKYVFQGNLVEFSFLKKEEQKTLKSLDMSYKDYLNLQNK